MKIQIATERPSSLINTLLQIWEVSVSATHHFLTKKDILSIKPFVKTALVEIPSLTCMAEANGMLIGFMGIDGDKIEMLFLALHAEALASEAVSSIMPSTHLVQCMSMSTSRTLRALDFMNISVSRDSSVRNMMSRAIPFPC